jgi:hypothetical protein
MTRILARAASPELTAPEIDWINGRVRVLGESYARASREVQSMLDDGTMIVTAQQPTE